MTGRERDLLNQFREIADKILANPNADGWIRLLEILRKSEKDKRIKSSPGASEFLELTIELASDAITASTAEQAIEPLIETSPIAIFAKPFKNNSAKARKGGPIRVAIAKQLKKNTSLKNPELFRIIASKPPKGWTFYDNSVGRYIEGPGNKNMDYARFCNVCSEERGAIKA